MGFSNVLSLQLIIIAVTAVTYMLSAATPLEKGVKWLSNIRLRNISMIVGAFLAIDFFVAGPSIFIINAFVQGIGDYLSALAPMSLTMGAFGQDTEFLSKFMLFTRGWWITWAPFVRIFAAGFPGGGRSGSSSSG